MKSALFILLGSILGALIYVSATYNLLPQDSGSYASFPNTIWISAAISIVGAFIFWGFFELFKVKTGNIALLIGVSLAAQLISWLSTLVFGNYGILTYLVATLIFSAAGSFLLSKLS